MIVNILSQKVSVVTLLCNISLGSEDLSLTSGDLLSGSGNIGLEVTVCPVLFVKKETSVIDFTFQALESSQVSVMAGLEIVVLKKFFVLKVVVLGLDSVQLVAESEVVLVTLLDLKNLSLKLGNKQVFLIRCEMNRVVVLQQFTEC